MFVRPVAGVSVRFAWDLLLVLALPVVGALVGGRPYGVSGAGAVWALVFAVIAVAFVASLAAHELAHAVVALRAGLTVRGVRLSVLGGAAEVSADRATPRNECTVALAGLGVSGAVGAVAGLLALPLHGANGPLFAICLSIAIINGVIVALNILPGFPLDGGRIIRAAAWYLGDDILQGTRIAAGYGQFLSWALLGLGVAVAFTAPIFGVWLLLVGYYVGRVGRVAFVNLLWQETSREIPLDAITGPGPLLAPDKRVGDVVEVFLSDRLSGPRPVGTSRGMVGVLDLDTNIRRIPRTQWMDTTVAQAMTPIEALPRLTLAPGLTLYDGLRLLDETGARTLAVVNSAGEVKGIITKERIDRWVRGRARESGFRIRKPPRRPF